MSKPGAWGRRWRRVLFGGAIGIVLVACAIPLSLRFSVNILCVDTKPMPASVDGIVVLGGDYYRRANRTVELFNSIPTKRIFVVGDGDSIDMAIYIKSKGIPEGAIVTEPESQNTMENARLCVPLLREAGVKRAAIVTSWFHSRRALACFEKAAPEIEFVCHPTMEDRPTNGWPHKYQRDTVLMEYAKLTGYMFRYGVWPF